MDIRISLDKNDQARFERACRTIPEKLFNRHVGRSANKAMTVVSRDAKKLAPKDSGDYRKSIGKKKKSYPRSKVVWIGVGPIKGRNNAYLGHLIEYGHRMVTGGTVARLSGRRKGRADAAGKQTGTGRVVGFVPPHPHLRPAMQRNKGAVLTQFRRDLHSGILEESRKV